MQERLFLAPQESTLHGHFSRDREPALWIDSGQRVSVSTLDVGWGLESPTDKTAPRRMFEPRQEGPALCGPIAVRGARAGTTLEIEVCAIRCGSYGFTYCGGPGFLNRKLNPRLGLDGERELLLWSLDNERGVAVCPENNWLVPLFPFPGILGMPEDVPGEQSAWIPRRTGGNMDCRELTIGSRLYLPVAVEGGLVSVGDGHARQGDGEIAGMGIECPFEEIELKFRVRPDEKLKGPVLWTPQAWITLGFSQDLEEASYQAIDAMLDRLSRELGITRRRAQGLASAVVDLRITQIVNGVFGVHAVWPHYLPYSGNLEDSA